MDKIDIINKIMLERIGLIGSPNNATVEQKVIAIIAGNLLHIIHTSSGILGSSKTIEILRALADAMELVTKEEREDG